MSETPSRSAPSRGRGGGLPWGNSGSHWPTQSFYNVGLRQSLNKNDEARQMASWTQQARLFGGRTSASTWHHYDDVVRET